MSKRENDGEIDNKFKCQKLDDVADEIAATVNGQNRESSPAIFKLNAICCDDLFEWLSLEDLHSLGQTCKRMNRLTGIYFRDNFTDTRFVCKDQNIYHDDVALGAFTPYVRKIQFESYDLSDFEYINEHGDSVSDISFDHILMYREWAKCFKKRLDQIDTVHLHKVRMNLNFHESFLKCYPNLKYLCVLNCDFAYIDGEWMRQKYPTIGDCFMELLTRKFDTNLKQFVLENDQLQRFSCDQQFILDNFDTFLKSSIRFDLKFDSFFFSYKGDRENLAEVRMYLNELHKLGFFKRLEFFDSAENYILQNEIDEIAKLQGLGELSISFKRNLVLPPIESLKVLSILNSNMAHIDLRDITQKCPNLSHVHLDTASTAELKPFVRHLLELKGLSIRCFDTAHSFPIDLSELSEERKKLPGACKLCIYVQENIYLKTKRAPKNLYANHDFIEIKRMESSNLRDFQKNF